MNQPRKPPPDVEARPYRLSSNTGTLSRTLWTGLSGLQAFILVGLSLAVLCVMSALIVSVIANSDRLFGTSLPEQSVGQILPSTTPAPSLTPSITPSPSATSTPSPPTATPTLVVPPDQINRDKINEIVAYIANIRGLEPLQDVPSRFLTRAELRQYLETEYAEAVRSRFESAWARADVTLSASRF